MSMNIYITPTNAERLRSLNREQSMSGLINNLLNDYWSGKGPDLFPPKGDPTESLPKVVDPVYPKVYTFDETKPF